MSSDTRHVPANAGRPLGDHSGRGQWWRSRARSLSRRPASAIHEVRHAR